MSDHPTISFVSIPVSDQDRAVEFYTTVLGFTVTADNRMGEQMRWLALRPTGEGTSITLVTWFPSMPAGSLKGMVLSVADSDATVSELREKGALPSDTVIQEQPWGRWNERDDPDGNGWLVQQTMHQL